MLSFLSSIIALYYNSPVMILSYFCVNSIPITSTVNRPESYKIEKNVFIQSF